MNTNNADFTVEEYSLLCKIAVKNYPIATYDNIPWGERFLLWRHDLDLSLNRGMKLATIERACGIKATYFLNPHSEFYNLAEKSQYDIVKKIIALGHDVGLHFDAGFYEEITEKKLNILVAQEADYLNKLFDVQPVAFSFHNPKESTLTFDADSYGGLLNCYSKQFKTGVPYCSDSNGYWRFRRLYDVLNDATDPCLQVLTHPGWWQDKPMPPRQRVFRSAFGRAVGILRTYDEQMRQHGRINHLGAPEALFVIKSSQPQRFQVCDYLWNQCEFQTLFLELWRIYDVQMDRLCKAYFRKVWAVPAYEVNAFFSSDSLNVDGWKLCNLLFNESWSVVAGVGKAEHQVWNRIRNQVIHGRSSIAQAELEQACVAICQTIAQLAKWGRSQSIDYDGLADLASVGLPTLKTVDGSFVDILCEIEDDFMGFSEKRWVEFKEKISKLEKQLM